jgi:hypothetical protein
MEGRAAEVAYVEMPQRLMEGAHPLTPPSQDRLFTGLENQVVWELEIPLAELAGEEVLELMAQVGGQQLLAQEEWEFRKSPLGGSW